MLLYLQIAFTILSAICIALVLPLGVWLGFGYAIALALGAVMFFMFMKLCKQTREFREKTNAPQDKLQEQAPSEQPTETDEHL